MRCLYEKRKMDLKQLKSIQQKNCINVSTFIFVDTFFLRILLNYINFAPFLDDINLLILKFYDNQLDYHFEWNER